MHSSSHLKLLLFPPGLPSSYECILDLACLFGCTLISLPSSLSDFARLPLLISAQPPVQLPCLPAPIPCKLCALVLDKYVWPAAAQLCSQSLHLGLPPSPPLWHSRRSRRREALYARVQSRSAISIGGIYKAATVYAQGCMPCLLSHFPLAPFHCPLTCDAADISGRLVNSSSDSGWEGRGG